MADKIEGIIISVKDYSENDALLTLIVKDKGINTYLVRGYKKTSRNLSANMQLFSYGIFLGTEPKNNGLGYLNGVEFNNFSNLTITDLKINAYFGHISELLIRTFGENIEINYWLEQFIASIQLIDKKINILDLVSVFEIQLLKPLGVMPDLHSDSIDGTKEGIFDYSEKYSGIIEKKHWYLDEHRLHLDNRVINILRWYAIVDLTKLNSINISEDTRRAVRRFIKLIYEKQVGIQTRSMNVIRQMEKLEDFS
jgi:DNA repair protein RecO